MNKAVKVLIIILPLVLILCAAGAAVMFLRHSDAEEIPDGDRMVDPIPTIPADAELYSLNWGQSASNEYECFVFNLSRDEDGCYISGKYVVSENDRHTEREAVPLTDEQWHSIERSLRE